MSRRLAFFLFHILVVIFISTILFFLTFYSYKVKEFSHILIYNILPASLHVLISIFAIIMLYLHHKKRFGILAPIISLSTLAEIKIIRIFYTLNLDIKIPLNYIYLLSEGLIIFTIIAFFLVLILSIEDKNLDIDRFLFYTLFATIILSIVLPISSLSNLDEATLSNSFFRIFSLIIQISLASILFLKRHNLSRRLSLYFFSLSNMLILYRFNIIFVYIGLAAFIAGVTTINYTTKTYSVRK